MIKDRNIRKWQPVAFLPEQRNMIEAQENRENLIPFPSLDEQRFEELNQIICEAMEYNKPLCIVYHKNGKFELMIGYIHYIDMMKKEIRIVDTFNTTFKIRLSEICDLRFN